MNNYFTITTDAETGRKVQRFFDSRISEDRTIKLKDIRFEKGLASTYCVIAIEPKIEGGTIEPSDIFFLGLFCQNY